MLNVKYYNDKKGTACLRNRELSELSSKIKTSGVWVAILQSHSLLIRQKLNLHGLAQGCLDIKGVSSGCDVLGYQLSGRAGVTYRPLGTEQPFRIRDMSHGFCYLFLVGS